MSSKAVRQIPASSSTGSFQDFSNDHCAGSPFYVALSRVRRLKNLRSIGLNRDIRAVMEEGPPDTLPAQFHKLFSEKEAQTALDADAAMIALGWA